MYRFVIVLLFSAVCGQLQINSTCDLSSIKPETDLSLALAGKWYQIERIPNSVEKGDCSSITIAIEVDNTTLTISGHAYNSEVASGDLVLRNASIHVTANPGVWNLTYNDGTSQNVVILGTDNTEYLMLYSCQDTGNSSATISAWKLGRNTTYSDNAHKATQALAVNANLADTTWRVISHSEGACKRNGALSLTISPILLLLLAIGFAKDL